MEGAFDIGTLRSGDVFVSGSEFTDNTAKTFGGTL